jgi:hypothetical protein
MPLQVLQRDPYFAGPRKQGDLFILKKGERSAVCELWSHQFGFELRLEAAGELLQSQVCRSDREVFDTFEEWKAAKIEDAAPVLWKLSDVVTAC